MKAGGNGCIRRISLIANPGSDFLGEIQLYDPKKARTRTERLGKWCRDVTGVFDSREEGLEENRRRHACGVRGEFINKINSQTS